MSHQQTDKPDARRLPNLMDLPLEEMEAFIFSSGKEKYRARQIMKWLYQSGVTSFETMTTLGRDFREKLPSMARIYRPTIARIQNHETARKRRFWNWKTACILKVFLFPAKTIGRFASRHRPAAPWTALFA